MSISMMREPFDVEGRKSFCWNIYQYTVFWRGWHWLILIPTRLHLSVEDTFCSRFKAGYLGCCPWKWQEDRQLGRVWFHEQCTCRSCLLDDSQMCGSGLQPSVSFGVWFATKVSRDHTRCYSFCFELLQGLASVLVHKECFQVGL